jgi:hypothetical protein
MCPTLWRSAPRRAAVWGLLALAVVSGQPVQAGTEDPWTHAEGKAQGSGVLVSHAVPVGVTAGTRVAVRLRLASARSADGASVRVRDLVDGRTLLSLQLEPGEVREVDVWVLARADGIQFLDVLTTQSGRTSVVSVPVHVGGGKSRLSSAGRPEVGAKGEAVVVLPATTTTSRR